MPYYPNYKADVEVVIKNKRPSKSNIYSGYRPAFRVKNDYLTTGIIKLKDCDVLNYENEAIAEIWFITPEFYPCCLEVGQIIPFQEGKIIHGYATITKINNELLDKQIKNRIIPKHLLEISDVVKVSNNTKEMKIKCDCGHLDFQIFKSIHPWEEYNGMIQKDGKTYLVQRSLFGKIKKIQECNDLFEKRPRTIIKIICKNCGKEHVLFDSYKHGYYAISNRLEESDDTMKFRQLDLKVVKTHIELSYAISFNDLQENMDCFNLETYLSAFTEIKIFGYTLKNKRQKICTIKTI